MKEYLVSVTIRTEVQLVVEAKSEQDAANIALSSEFVIAERVDIPDVVLRNDVITVAQTGIIPENSVVITEITNPNLKKRVKNDGSRKEDD